MIPRHVLLVLHVEGDSGPQRSLAPRLERLAEDGARVTSLLPAEGPALTRARELGDVRTGGPRPLLFPRRARETARLRTGIRAQAAATEEAVHATEADLVVISSPTLAGALTGARRAGAKTLLYCGEVPAEARARGLAWAVLARVAVRRANALVAPSRAAAERYLAAGADVTVVHPPIEAPPAADQLARRGAELRASLGVGPRERLVCSLGAITAGRGQDVLVEALRRSDARPPWRLVIGGEPYERPRDREFASRLDRMVAGLDDRARLAGRIEDPYALYAAADVFVNPARVPEGFGRAACEALTASCPVVSTRVGGVEEALRDGETALLVEPDSPSELAGAIERLLEQPELASGLATAGRDDVGQRLAPEVDQPAFLAAVERALTVT